MKSTIWVLFLLNILFTFIFLARRKKRVDSLPFLINLFVAALLLLLPFNKFGLTIEFMTYKNEREQIIVKVQQGDIQLKHLNKHDLRVSLPPQDSHLSKGGGEILVNSAKTEFFFYTFRGILDDFNGFCYSASDDTTKILELIGDYKELEHIAPKWYWVSS